MWFEQDIILHDVGQNISSSVDRCGRVPNRKQIALSYMVFKYNLEMGVVRSYVCFSYLLNRFN